MAHIMKHDRIIGIEHQLAPYLIAQQLAQAQDDTIVSLFLSESAVLGLLDGALSGFPDPVAIATSLEQIDSQHCLHVICDLHHLPAQASAPALAATLEKIEQTLSQYLPAGVRRSTFCFGPCADDAPAEVSTAIGADAADTGPLAAAARQVVNLLDDIERRAPNYFSRYPLRLPNTPAVLMRLLSATRAAQFLAAVEATAAPGRHLVLGTQPCNTQDLISCAAALSARTIQTIFDDNIAHYDAVSSVLHDGLLAISKQCHLERTDVAESVDGLQVHTLAGAADISMTVQRAVQAEAHEQQAMQRPFSEVPGITLKDTAKESLKYFSYGTGPQVLLIVNAFGMTLDFWQMLPPALGSDFKLIAIENQAHENSLATISETCYTPDDYVGGYLADVAAVMAAEGVEQYHVASWCSGAKLAMELVCASPASIKSLSFIAPSFAGVEGFTGSDSPYEKNLHTMCKLVNQMPKTAANMANSMMAIMKRTGNDLERFQKDKKDAVEVMGLADSHHLPLLYQPFLSGENLVAFSKQLVHFRAHNIKPRLSDKALQLPIMLVTGVVDTTTSSDRAKDICKNLPNIAGFELKGSGHYLIHQNYPLVAELLTKFIANGIDLQTSNPRVTRSLLNKVTNEH
jgi:pimeloyl-ACP methyl ester carboxylesterase